MANRNASNWNTKTNNFPRDEDEVDDYTFLNHPKHGSSGYMLGNADNYYGISQNDRQSQLQDELHRINESTLNSSERCLGMVYESERMGVATAEELIHQREQLQNCEQKIDEVNTTLRTTQKHINSIKSLFGGLKSYFSKTPEHRPKISEESRTPASSALEGVVEHVRQEQPAAVSVHPALRIRGLQDSSELDDTDLEADPRNHGTSRYADINSKFDKNLDEMCAGLGRLKGLARGLGDEIDDQNILIERITDKSETGEMKLAKQNVQMRRILGQ